MSDEPQPGLRLSTSLPTNLVHPPCIREGSRHHYSHLLCYRLRHERVPKDAIDPGERDVATAPERRSGDGSRITYTAWATVEDIGVCLRQRLLSANIGIDGSMFRPRQTYHPLSPDRCPKTPLPRVYPRCHKSLHVVNRRSEYCIQGLRVSRSMVSLHWSLLQCESGILVRR